MVNKKLKIIWTKTAKDSLKDICHFYKPKSLRAAKNVINEIVETAKNVKYPQQYQIDEIDERYRRMVVSNFKIL